MDKYKVKLMARAARDLDEIYNYIIDEFKTLGTAEHMADLLDDAILGLDELPYWGAIRRVGAYANKGYHQLFVKNFIIVHQINVANKTVIIVTIRYMPSSF